MSAVIDAGVLYALADDEDPGHKSVRAALEGERGALLVPQSVLCEAGYLIGSRLGPRAEAAFVASLAAADWHLEPLVRVDLERAAVLIDRYADAGLGFVDASIVAICERLGVHRIYTLDRRHFSLVRPGHVEAFELLPWRQGSASTGPPRRGRSS